MVYIRGGGNIYIYIIIRSRTFTVEDPTFQKGGGSMSK